MTQTFTQREVNNIVEEARIEAHQAANTYFALTMNGYDGGACGFAWVNIYEHNGKKIAGNTKLGKMLKAAGVRQDHTRAFQIWNPSGHRCQNGNTLDAGADAAAKVFKRYGFTAYAFSRMD